MNFWESVGNFFSTVTSEFGYMDKYILDGSALSIALICLSFLTTIVIAYLLGSINFAIIISGSKYKQDIRDFGSKNAGMTNMMRTYGKKAAARLSFIRTSWRVLRRTFLYDRSRIPHFL